MVVEHAAFNEGLKLGAGLGDVESRDVAQLA